MSLRATDIAFETLKDIKDGLSFKDLWTAVSGKLGYDETQAKRKMSQFYTDLSLDGRFAALEKNCWNLKIHCHYDDVAVNMDELEEDVDEESEEEENDLDIEEENVDY